MRFKDQVALISAAGAGIGKASAEIMVREGATVVAMDVDLARVEAMRQASEAAGNPGQVIPRKVDALAPDQVAEVVAWAVQNCGRIDVLVNAVGGSTIIDNPNAATDELDFDDWQRLIAFNLDGTFLFTNAVIPFMKRQHAGRIVNLASIAGRGLSVNSSSAYAAAKAGVMAFTRCSAVEAAEFGVRINAVAPSIAMHAFLAKVTTDELLAELSAKEAFGRPAEVWEVANAMIFLASDLSSYMTGEVLSVSSQRA